MQPSRHIPLSVFVFPLGMIVGIVIVAFVINVEKSIGTGIFASALAVIAIGLITGMLYWVTRELERREERLRVFVEIAYDGIITTNDAGRIETVNPSVASMFGYRPGQLIGEHLSVLLSSKYGERREDERFKEYLLRVELAELGVPHEVRGLCQDGRQFPMDISINRARAGANEFYAIMVRDVSARVAALKVLRKAKEELEKRVKERTSELEETNTRLEGEMARRSELIAELQAALSEIKTLSGLLPICASCKKIRDDKGYWSQIEVYIRDHSNAEFSHGMCPDCVRELYPELDSAKLDSG